MGARTVPSMPTMPLNTDGIDPYGSNITIRRVNFTNFDDAVAVKPMHGGDDYKVGKDGCSQDILVEDCNVKFGVGMSIGSVPPHNKHSCVRRVTFRNINFEYPLKAIYIKSNPGNDDQPDETGEIRDILYENIKMHFPVWFAMYIGP
jgi:polygalacturonase